MENVFVYVEIEGTTVQEVSQELLTKGRKLANELGVELHAVVIGTGIKGKVEDQILPYGVDKLFVFDGEGLFATSVRASARRSPAVLLPTAQSLRLARMRTRKTRQPTTTFSTRYVRLSVETSWQRLLTPSIVRRWQRCAAALCRRLSTRATAARRWSIPRWLSTYRPRRL